MLGITLWGENTSKLFKIQKKFIRIISNSSYNTHTEPLFKQLGILKMVDLYHVSLLSFYYKFCHHKLPNFFTHFNLSRISIHNIHYDMRPRNVFPTPYCRTRQAEHRIRYRLPHLLNSTPECILNKVYTHSCKGFTNYIKIFYLHEYSDICEIRNCYICGL